MTKRVSLTGIDGSGKTTVIRELVKLEGQGIGAFRAPQYHEDPRVPHSRLSADIDAMSVLSDRLRDPMLKATALFLSVTLYGDIERWFIEQRKPDLLFGERQPLLDSLVYSLFYTKLLSGPIDRSRVEGDLLRAVGKEGIERMEEWSRGLFDEPRAFWNMPVHARRLFELEPRDLLPRLRDIYRVDYPDQLILLKVSREALVERLLLKKGSGNQREIHEEQQVLEKLQNALKSCLAPLRLAAPSMKVSELEVSALTVRETRDAVLEAASGA